MKRLLIALLCCLVLSLPVLAAGEDNTMQVTSVVNADGSSQMAVQLTLHMDTLGELVIPLGEGACNVTVNGVSMRVRKINGVPSVVLGSETGLTGTQSLSLVYTLQGCVRPTEGWRLTVPLLAKGLAYPIQKLTFQVTLPGAFEQTPNFSSGYYGEDVDNYMTITVRDNVISGTVNAALRDQEELILTMDTDPKLFPRTNEAGKTLPVVQVGSVICVALVLLYWLLRLFWRPVRAVAQAQVPVGVGPGEVGCRLLAASPDLPLMVVAWAQMGYLTIHVSQEHAVTLHKRMDMGNERSKYENKLFKALFGRGQIADGGGRRFQDLRARVAGSAPRVRGQFRKRSGLPGVLRLLGAVCGLLTGLGIGDLLAPPVAWRVAVLIAAAILGAVAAWVMQAGLRSTLTWPRRAGWIALGAVAAMLALGLMSGCAGLALACCLLQGLIGLLTLFGGRRSDTGRLTVQALLGLRRYLRTVDRKQLRRIMSRNPGYYYDMAPYALALGVDKQFAGQFQSMRLPACPWLVTDFPQSSRAGSWYVLLRQVTQILRGRTPPKDPKPRRKRPRQRTHSR